MNIKFYNVWYTKIIATGSHIQGGAVDVKSAILFFVKLSLAVPLRVLGPVGHPIHHFSLVAVIGLEGEGRMNSCRLKLSYT